MMILKTLLILTSAATSQLDAEVVKLRDLLDENEVVLQQTEKRHETIIRICKEINEQSEAEVIAYLEAFAVKFPHLGTRGDFNERCWFYSNGRRDELLKALNRNTNDFQRLTDEGD